MAAVARLVRGGAAAAAVGDGGGGGSGRLRSCVRHVAATPRRCRDDHWYTAAYGTPCYQIPTVKDPAQSRAPDVRDARRLALVPSVTTVLDIVNRPGIQYWRMQQYLLAVRELHERGGLLSSQAIEPPPTALASPDVLESAAAEDADELPAGLDEAQWRAVQALYYSKIGQAAELGSDVHALLERHLRWRYRSPRAAPAPEWPAALAPMRDAVDHWLDEAVADVVHIERSFASRYGYGGKVDLVCQLRDGRTAVCDFKTQAAKRRFTLRNEWPCQLAGYAVGLGLPTAQLINVCLDTVSPGTCRVHDWTADGPPGCDANARYWETFRLAFLLWCSPLGRHFDVLRDVPSAVPIPTWDEVLRHAASGLSFTVLAPDEGVAETASAAAKYIAS